MKITPENLKKHELIGLKATVKNSPNPYQEGVEGHVLNETRKTLNISGKIIPKKGCSFIFNLPEGIKVKVNGNKIYGSPENRIKN
ncbi:ribonuclease P protein subunit [Methanonatronarchaeum sp. AMET-Sl]|uniref:ribonuclease P protein component 1 n=1 Tax=Methanonatronarchaeum sp. AMET-Sl TaxID=3037654 RepID=UPI00244DF355|nr:ribonuclease P protein subunit [Methanonatronarchaeum sp. AMET-Sl]WGI17227.1 ribonuclease P protein subunit [Methanonatronarchaeum sp. AMET-Sl]